MYIVAVYSKFIALLDIHCYVKISVLGFISTVTFLLHFYYAFIFRAFLNVDLV